MWLKQVKLWFYKLAAAGLAAVRKIQNYKLIGKNEKKLICSYNLFKHSIWNQKFPKVLTLPCSGMVKKGKVLYKPKTATQYEFHKKPQSWKKNLLKSKLANKNFLNIQNSTKNFKNSFKTALQWHAEKSRKNSN